MEFESLRRAIVLLAFSHFQRIHEAMIAETGLFRFGPVTILALEWIVLFGQHPFARKSLVEVAVVAVPRINAFCNT